MTEPLDALYAGAAIARSRAHGRVPLLALSGSQGSGKSTLAKTFAEKTGALHLALDDFYLTKADREAYARAIHPLFATRGVPGTHDMGLMTDTIGALMSARDGAHTPLPIFDKVSDDRLPRDAWRIHEGRPDLIILEGWCLGAREEREAALAPPINALEREEDRQGIWRHHVNAHLAGDYLDFFIFLDAIVFLQAPSFEIVQRWRMQQEAGLLGHPTTQADDARIARFIAHYERITRHMLAGGVRADVLVKLDEERRIRAATP